MATEAVVRKWGNSLGVVLSSDFVEAQHLQENDTILVEVVKVADLSKSFGALKGKLRWSGQRFKNLVRAGWEP